MSDLAQEPGEGSLHQTAGGQSGDSLERRRICCDGLLTPLPDAKAGGSRLEEGLPACMLSCPHPGELSGGWGEFEGFRESSAKSEQFSQSFELLGRAAEHQPLRTPSVPKEHGSCQVQQGGPWVSGTAAGPSSEVFLWLSAKYFCVRVCPGFCVLRAWESCQSLSLLSGLSFAVWLAVLCLRGGTRNGGLGQGTPKKGIRTRHGGGPSWAACSELSPGA